MLSCVAAAPAAAQQYNLLLPVPPSADISREKTRDISAGYYGLSGAHVGAGALDVTLVTGGRLAGGRYRTAAAGTALLGSVGPGRISIDGTAMDLSAITFHERGAAISAARTGGAGGR